MTPAALFIALLLGAASPSPAPATQAPSSSETESDARLAARLLVQGSGGQKEIEVLLAIAWDPRETAGIREASLRRLRAGDARVVALLVGARIADAPPAVQIGMLSLMRDVYRRIGGVDFSLNNALAERIRTPDPAVAREAIAVCSDLGIKEAYLPLREIASQPDTSLRSDAIQAMARIKDARAVSFFTKLLQEPSSPRDALYRALAEVGRPSAYFLKSRLDDPEPAERARALDALLVIATPDDLTALYTYVHKYPPDGDRKKQIYDKIAALEAAQFERVPED